MSAGSKKGLFRDTGKGHRGALSTATMGCGGRGEKGTVEGPHPCVLHKHLSTTSYVLCWEQSTSLAGLGEHFLISYIFTFSSSQAAQNWGECVLIITWSYATQVGAMLPAATPDVKSHLLCCPLPMKAGGLGSTPVWLENGK